MRINVFLSQRYQEYINALFNVYRFSSGWPACLLSWKGYIRPGCIILTIFVAMPKFMWGKVNDLEMLYLALFGLMMRLGVVDYMVNGKWLVFAYS